MCSLDLEPCSAWRETYRKARKVHRCTSCSAVIPAGTRYLYISFVFGGRGGDERACEACDVALNAFAASHDSKPMPSDFKNVLRDCIDRHTPRDRVGPDEWAAELAGLNRRFRTSPAGRARLREGWMRRAVSRELAATRARLRSSPILSVAP